jgi:hypothetical protein
MDDTCVVAGRQAGGPGLTSELEQPAEAEETVAADARVRRFPPAIPGHERLDDRAQELLAGIDGDVRNPEPVACRSGGDHGLRRAARALGVRPVGVDPEPQGHADRVGPCPEECNGAVHAAAHRDGDTVGIAARLEDRADGACQGVHCKLVATDGGGLEKRQAFERAVEPIGVGADDSVAVHRQADEPPLAVPRRVSDDLEHRATVAEE